MIYEVTPLNWQQLITNANRFITYSFRGQSNFQWNLSTNLERLALQNYKKLEYLANREFWILTQFRRRAHNLLERSPTYDELIEWLALLQHYGGPTRLLDFTDSLFLGLFFACEGAREDAAVWMIDLFALLNAHAPMQEDETIYHQKTQILEIAKGYVGKDSDKGGILPIEPERLNERMSIQKGLSMFPMNINQTFMNNLKAQFDWKVIRYKRISFKRLLRTLHTKNAPHVIKLRIKAEWCPELLGVLNDMNINANSLFPGLDGFARSLRIHLA